MFLILTDPKPHDYLEFFEMNKDPQFQKEFLNLKMQSKEEAKEVIQNLISRRQNEKIFDYAFIKIIKEESVIDHYDSSNSKMIGFITLGQAGETDYLRSGFKLLLNYGIMEKYSGKGLMTNALNTRFKKYIQSEISFIPAYIKGFNPSSERVLAKCGFIKIDDNNLGSTYVKRLCLDMPTFQANFRAI
jgi:RimJ/RimL family protein N-acetyltransferase